MVKKADGSSKKRKREVVVNEEEEEDIELEAEIAALQSIRAEQAEENELQPKTTSYNKAGLLQALENMETDTLPFLETFQICEFNVDIEDQHDDLQREMSFYKHALLAVKSGRDKLESLGIPSRRPLDFFCENLKTDAHMNKIKDKLILEDKKMEAFELRKQREMNKKFNKQVSILKKEEKAQKVKAEINETTKQRKGKSSPAPSLDRLQDGDDSGSIQKKSSKRVAMDKKYGFGGKSHAVKRREESKSLSDMSGFNPRGGKDVRRERRPKGGGGSAAGKSRPGKAARTEQRSKRRKSG